MRPLAALSPPVALAIILLLSTGSAPAAWLQATAVTGSATPEVASPAASPAASPVARSPEEARAFWRGAWSGTTADGGSRFFLHNGTIVTRLQFSVRCPELSTQMIEFPPLRALTGTPFPPPPAAAGWEFYTESWMDRHLRSGESTATTGPQRLEFKAKLVTDRTAVGELTLMNGFDCGNTSFVTQWTATKA